LKVAIIDLGFNTVKLACYYLQKDNSYKAYRQDGVSVRLGEGMSRKGYLENIPIQRTVTALKLFRDVLTFEGIDQVIPVATSAVRDAKNKLEFLEQVKNETGFKFRVLSGAEEAIYSFIGALESTCYPSCLFFDLGGGSLEMIYAEKFEIKRLRSLPLGALRLSLEYAKKDGTFSRKSYEKMKRHVLKMLPTREEMGIGTDTELVGVGGSLRALARFDQEDKEYLLDKIHNYKIDYDSITSISKIIGKMNSDELADIKSIGNNRSRTIVAGCCVIAGLMERFGFERVVVSAHGLREGVLSVSAKDPETLFSINIKKRAKSLITSACKVAELLPFAFNLVEPFVSAGMLRENERSILNLAMHILNRPMMIANLHNLFHIILDEDLPYLSHREQIVLALAVIHAQKEKTAEWLFERYSAILRVQNKCSIEKISALCTTARILEYAKATVQVSILKHKASITIISGNKLPIMLLEDAFKKCEKAFDISINYQFASSRIPLNHAKKESR